MADSVIDILQLTATEYQLVKAMNLTLLTTSSYDEIRAVVQRATELQAAKGGRRMLEVSVQRLRRWQANQTAEHVCYLA